MSAPLEDEITESIRGALRALREARVRGDRAAIRQAWGELRALLLATEPKDERIFS